MIISDDKAIKQPWNKMWLKIWSKIGRKTRKMDRLFGNSKLKDIDKFWQNSKGKKKVTKTSVACTKKILWLS